MELEKLKRLEPLPPGINSFESEFVNVLQHKQLRFTFFSDCEMTFSLIFNPTGEREKDYCFTENLQANKWKSMAYHVILPYAKIRLVKRIESQPHVNLVINCIGRATPLVQKIESNEELSLTESRGFIVPREEPEKKESEPEKRTKSPFRGFLKGKTKEDSPKKLLRDDRLPNLILKNQLLVGGRFQNVSHVPPPIENLHEPQFLCFHENQFQWLLPDEMATLTKSDEKVGWKI